MKLNVNKQKIKIILIAYFLLAIISSCGDCMNFDTKIIDISFLPNSYVIPNDSNLEFQLLTEEIVVTNFPRLNLNLIQSAYATGCADIYNPIKRIIDIKVTSSQNFSSQYQAGSSLNNIVNVRYYNGSQMENVNSNLTEYLNWISQLGIPGRSAFNFETFSIIERPEQSEELSLILEFTFTDDSTFILVTENILWE